MTHGAARADASPTSGETRTVTARALGLLAAFDDEHRALTLTELARRADLPASTAHRLVGELVRWGALTRRDSGEFVVGRRLWRLGLLAPTETGLREIASPFLHDLYGATLATVHLAVRDGVHALYLDRVSGHGSVPVVSDIGTRLPLHTTAVGKVLLAHAPDEVREQALRHLPRLTAYTVCQPGPLADQLARTLRDDYASTREEMTLGACSVAVPVRHGDRVVAALGMVLSTQARTSHVVGALRVASRGIGRELDAGTDPGRSWA